MAVGFYETNFNPTAPKIIHVKKMTRIKLIFSLKNKTPIRTAPVAPSPVQIAYAVARGISRIAKAKNKKPNEKTTTTIASHLQVFFIKYILILATPKISPKLAINK